MTKYIVCPADEIPEGGRKILTLAGRSIGVFNVAGEFYALRNRCPHQGGPLCAGELSGLRLATTPGRYQYKRPGQFLRCPWHGWEFEIKTGRSWFDPSVVRVKQFPVEVGKPVEGSVPGPFQAETYPVSVEKSYLLLEIAGSPPSTNSGAEP